jgi:hypothetical protein
MAVDERRSTQAFQKRFLCRKYLGGTGKLLPTIAGEKLGGDQKIVKQGPERYFEQYHCLRSIDSNICGHVSDRGWNDHLGDLAMVCGNKALGRYSTPLEGVADPETVQTAQRGTVWFVLEHQTQPYKVICHRTKSRKNPQERLVSCETVRLRIVQNVEAHETNASLRLYKNRRELAYGKEAAKPVNHSGYETRKETHRKWR